MFWCGAGEQGDERLVEVGILDAAVFSDVELLEEALVELPADGWWCLLVGVGAVAGCGQCSLELGF